jgi:hypothetical protein
LKAVVAVSNSAWVSLVMEKPGESAELNQFVETLTGAGEPLESVRDELVEDELFKKRSRVRQESKFGSALHGSKFPLSLSELYRKLTASQKAGKKSHLKEGLAPLSEPHNSSLGAKLAVDPLFERRLVKCHKEENKGWSYAKQMGGHNAGP